MQLRYIGWRLTLGNIVKKAGDKHVTNALGAIQKQLDEAVRRLASIDSSISTIEANITTIDTNIAAIVIRLNTGDVDFT